MYSSINCHSFTASDCYNKFMELQNQYQEYTTLRVSKQQQMSLYDSPQQQQHIYESPQDLNEKPAVSSLVPELESKEVISSNVHVTNSVGNYSIQKERVKWSILLILLIALTVLSVITLITLFTSSLQVQVTCPQVSNTTDVVSSIESAERLSCDDNTTEALLQQIHQLISLSNANNQLLDGTTKNVTASLQKLGSIMNMQSMINNISVENKGTINNILVKVDNVLETLNSSLVSSCQDIKNKQPNSPSGYYHINSQITYCEMGELCNSTEGGWIRLAYLDMTDSTVDCPPGFMLHVDETAGVRACGRPDSDKSSCPSVKFSSNGISYSEVCGRVVGYQYDSPFALRSSSASIDSYYIDGISITQGFPRKHVWSLIVGAYNYSLNITSNCPCHKYPGNKPPPFVDDNHYFCESGNPTNITEQKLYIDNPLWDGEGCGTPEEKCCAVAGLPWFHRTLNTTTDYIELRDCGNTPTSNGNVFIRFYEVYVQ